MKQDWMLILFTTVILGTLGFLGMQVFDMKAVLSGVSMKLDNTDQRVIKIAEVLPDIRVRVASEEINKNLSGFVTTMYRVQVGSNKHVSAVLLYNAARGELKKFHIVDDDKSLHDLDLKITGLVKFKDATALSFAELIEYASEVGIERPGFISIKPHSSFALRKADINEYSKHLARIAESHNVYDVTVTDVEKLNNWKDIVKQLSKIDDAYTRSHDLHLW